MSSSRRPVLLVICDGWGVAPPSPGNAITLARTPVFDRWMNDAPGTVLEASGEAVGLPAGLMGNSEVGHLNLGAGRMVPQDLLRIDLTLRDGSFFENPALARAADHARRPGASLHLLGLLSDGGVHSHIRHLFGLLELARRRGVPRVYVHAFLDGRDTPPRSAPVYVRALQEELARIGGAIASITGRFYAMDRDSRWERTALAWAALRRGEGRRVETAEEGLAAAEREGETDEFVKPTVVVPSGGEPVRIRDGDSVVFFNFRADRARQLTRVMAQPGFDAFDRGAAPDLNLVTFTQYQADLPVPAAFPPVLLKRILAEVWGERGIRNLRIAETEKYAHVTYFFNGGVEAPYPAEERILVPSWRGGATYDLHPQMSASEITAEVERALSAGSHPMLVVNFANADMVGHTGMLAPTISAIETLDACFARLEAAATRAGAILAMTADHGNAEQMIDPATGQPHTAHTVNPVPFLLLGGAAGLRLRTGGSLGDVGPTLLALQGIEQPPEMTGRNLIIEAPLRSSR
ncbi:MAG TPA: 2,3-bisphosphoglycerate-independent phosphoglycerate mutase [Thermoanaerobaculia bacterium]|nr:2,3-bisphosphoglycerate-independent phosphoglycerate mutase [Thermoanaerobaculia bacterium]